MELLLIVSFIAGILTVLAPCSITLLPVILGGSATSNDRWRPYIVIASLGVSVFIFSFALQLFSSFIEIDESARRFISGIIIVLMGLFLIFPEVWDRISTFTKVGNKSEQALSKAGQRTDRIGAIATGAALGPVFTTCSPTFIFILSVIIQVENNVFFGGLNILVFTIGLCAIMLFIALLGQRFVQRIKFAANPKGIFRRAMGVLFVLIGISVIYSFDKVIQTELLNYEAFENFDVTNIDQRLLDSVLDNEKSSK